ncbi:hypothetical protein PF006_g8174 [Phytophthora fragariae]|uniref:Uncharacterized protein n=1 Tax=Phytophthora fragariae TaxID=53985 RepID=A0A6A3UB64_9STRA|nr:hypothetical protein PF006_g8174 [Phytophthora fragariae]
MAERGAAAAGGLRSEQQQAERMARELMDMKIETAHLRERLRLRVGGDTTAAELEAEAFALQTALAEAQQEIKAREAELQALDGRYQKAMQGLMRLDEAWKLSRAQASDAQNAQDKAEQQAEAAASRSSELEQQLQAAGERETVLAARVDALMQEKRQAEQQRDEHAQDAKHREMQAHELRAQLETTRQRFETQMKQQEGATREDVRKLQEQLQRAQEDAAALRGEIHARQEEAAKVDAELRDTKEAEAAAKQRLVKLTEDHATLRVHLESAKLVAVESTQRAIEAEAENEDMRKELEEREDVLREKEQTMRALEEELVQKQKAEINKRDVLTATLKQTKLKLATTKRQLGAQKQLEADNAKFRAEYEKAKLAMERMATRKAKSLGSAASMPVQPTGHDSGTSSGSSDTCTSIGKENRPAKGAVAPIVKRKLEVGETDTSDVRTTPRKAQRSKHVYVASRYLSSASKR